MRPTVALFGEAGKGCFDAAYLCHTPMDLCTHLGHSNSCGISLAIKTLMYNYSVVYFRVKEEGYSIEHYFYGIHFLNTQNSIKNIIAIALPGVGDDNIIEALCSTCKRYSSLLLFSEKDLYDLFTF
ncbi:hypothetical protein [Chlamydiifrater phoenicopteri]|uniref:hypothetical protein n=1 Tax=Chlamydiifrater phoenicopteri TaxID=2681469 RepID=UPI001BCF4F72|nr:hypothetical protein [Chlamydiifrater phoenicopteri]